MVVERFFMNINVLSLKDGMDLLVMEMLLEGYKKNKKGRKFDVIKGV